eukprot:403331696
MRNHPKISQLIGDKDSEPLMYLTDIRSKLHDHGFGFDLIFYFNNNPFFKDNIVTKSYFIHKQSILEEIKGYNLLWIEDEQSNTSNGTSLTNKLNRSIKRKLTNQISQLKKAVNSNKNSKTFFSFFRSKTHPTPQQIKAMTVEQEDELRELMEQDLELGLCFKDQLIPLAVEYFLGVYKQRQKSCSNSSGEGLSYISSSSPNDTHNSQRLDSTQVTRQESHVVATEDVKLKSKMKSQEITRLYAKKNKDCKQQ